ncbi:MAG: DUF2721 domain-containing protein [Elusimicrobia bacterium]|nr:DUF2721 domain-containing protein [Elusimicrobiota bacterium]
MDINDGGGESVARILQYSISPVVLISAVGLMLLTLTNRFGRAIDRCRDLGRTIDKTEPGGRVPYQEQLRIVARRARWLQYSIVLVVSSLILSCLMIFLMFLKILAGWPVGPAIIVAFGLNVLCLIGSLSYFVLDLFFAVEALEIEVSRHLEDRFS